MSCGKSQVLYELQYIIVRSYIIAFRKEAIIFVNIGNSPRRVELVFSLPPTGRNHFLQNQANRKMVALVAWAPSLAAMPDDPCKPPPSFVLSLLSLPPRHAPAALLSKGEDEREGGAKGGREEAEGRQGSKKTATGCFRLSSLPTDDAGRQEAWHGGVRDQNKLSPPCRRVRRSKRRSVHLVRCPFFRLFAPFVPEEERRFLSQTFLLPPFILGNFGLTTHNNIFFDRRHRAILSLSLPPSFLSPPILFRRPSLPATNGSIPLLLLRLGGKVLLTLIAIVVLILILLFFFLLAKRGPRSPPSTGYSECGWDHWDSGGETFFQASIHSARPLPFVGANCGP